MKLQEKVVAQGWKAERRPIRVESPAGPHVPLEAVGVGRKEG